MMRLTLAAVLAVTSTATMARPSSLSMTCRQAQNLVASQGAVVISTGAHTYDRFVASPRFCEFNEWANAASAPTKDRRQCSLGYTCTTTPPLEYDPGDLFGPQGRW